MNNFQNHNKPRIFSSLINQDTGLDRLYQHTKFLLYLNKCLNSVLAEPLNQHCQIANYDKSTLTILADSPAWSTRLRYNTSDILSRMRTDFGLDSLKTIRIKTRPIDTPVHARHRKLLLSSSAAKFINQIAGTITDEKLRLSLLKLAKHHKKAV